MARTAKRWLVAGGRRRTKWPRFQVNKMESDDDDRFNKKVGESLLLLAPWEQYFLYELKDLPLEKFPYPNVDPDVKVKIEESMNKIDTSLKEAAYHAWLGCYNSITAIASDNTSLVEAANQFAVSIGFGQANNSVPENCIEDGIERCIWHSNTKIA